MGLEISNQEQKLLATVTTSGAVSSTNVGQTAISRPRNGMIFVCDLTAAATDVGDTLDVKVQTNLGGLWVDVAYFTQMLGNGGTKRFAAKIMAQTAFALGDVAGALTAGNVRHLFGDEWRVNYVTVDANANSSFTFSVYAIPF
jgi:hypothetical protein